MRRAAHLALLLLAPLVPASAAGQSGPALETRVATAIDRGVAHLLALYADGRGSEPAAGDQRNLLVERPGLRALTLYTLLESGVDARAPVVERLAAGLAFERFDDTYDASCMLLALVQLDPIGQRAWIDELAGDLLRWQQPAGDWGYPEGGDLSNTQFAALALRAASSSGVEVPPQVWSKLARGLLRYTARDGGCVYAVGGRHSTGSMTCAGAGLLAMCEIELARRGALPAELEAELQRARAQSVHWLTENFSVERNPQSTAWTHYYLYGLERLGALAGIERIGAHDWYREGAQFLVASQDDAGDWPGTFERVPALFALLFLNKATATRAPATPTQPPGAKAAPGTAPTGAVRLEASGTRPLQLWISGWAGGAVTALEWPGERGAGPRVVRVEYLADGQTIAAALGDPERPAGGAAFRCEAGLLAGGEHFLSARVLVRPPPPESEPRRTQVLLSNVVEIELPAPPAQPSPRPASHSKLLSEAHPKAKSSSVFDGPAPWNARGFDARLAVDGLARTPWIAAADDALPTLRITLDKSVRADRIRIAPARLVPRSPAFLTLPRELAVRINGGETRTLVLAPGEAGWCELRLEKALGVSTLELRIVARQEAGKAVGLGEVELDLSSSQPAK